MNTWGGERKGAGRKKGKHVIKDASGRLSECLSIHVSPDELALITRAMGVLEVENRSRWMAGVIVRWCRNILRGG